MYQIKFLVNRIGFVTVKFDIPFGDITVFYKMLDLKWKPANGVSYSESFSYEAQRIRIRSIEMHGDRPNIGWDRLDVSDIRTSILLQILDIKNRQEGIYVQDSEYNWLP
jgi:hypothetical protein